LRRGLVNASLDADDPDAPAQAGDPAALSTDDRAAEHYLYPAAIGHGVVVAHTAPGVGDKDFLTGYLARREPPRCDAGAEDVAAADPLPLNWAGTAGRARSET